MLDLDQLTQQLSELRHRLEVARQVRGWSQAQLAKKAGLTRGGFAHIENGRTVPSVTTLLLLADALGVTAGWLLEGPVAARRPERDSSAPSSRSGPIRAPERARKPASRRRA